MEPYCEMKNRSKEVKIVGACAMITKFLDNKIALSKFYCRGVSHGKQHFGRFSSLPPRPAPLKKRKFYFYCRLDVSEIGQACPAK